jgi:hypothetical protein
MIALATGDKGSPARLIALDTKNCRANFNADSMASDRQIRSKRGLGPQVRLSQETPPIPLREVS